MPLTDINAKLTQSQKRYARESARSSPSGESEISTIFDSVRTQSPTQPESEQSYETMRHSDTPFYLHSLPVPYQPPTIDDLLRKLTYKYEIREDLGDYLRLLEDYEIIILCDDSGSMKTTVDNSNRTRWDELCDIVKIVLEIGTIFDSSGVDIYFLNRPHILNVTDPEAVNREFAKPPSGYTPLVRSLERIFQLPSTRRGNDKKTLVFVATDGAPTDDKGNITIRELEHLMIEGRRVETTHVMFLICTDDPVCVEYLSNWDTDMINVDVTDDYRTEREKIRQYNGRSYPFSKGDYIVKALIGAIHKDFDNLNEPPRGTDED